MKRPKQVMTADELQEELQRLHDSLYVQNYIFFFKWYKSNRPIKKLPDILQKVFGIR